MARASAKTRSKKRSASTAGGAKPAKRGAETRPLWSGQLKLSLVTVPVLVVPATRTGGRIAFHQVHEPTGQRVHHEKVVPGVGPVDKDDIRHGFEVSKGHYILLSDEEIDKVKIEARKTIDLIQFVDADEIDPVWFEHPYYLLPDGDLAEEAYVVLREALRKAHKIGIGQFVMRGHEYIAAIKPYENGLLLETMHYPDEIRDAKRVFTGLKDSAIEPDLLDMAKTLIDQKSRPFQPSDFRDEYSVALRSLIERKRKGRGPVAVEEEEEPARRGNVVSLVEALKRSLAQSGGKAAPARGHARRHKAS